MLYLHPKFNRYGRTFYKWIRVALAEQNKTNRWLAEHIGKSEITVSRWVQNKAQPSLEQLLHVAKVLSVSPKDLINDINE